MLEGVLVGMIEFESTQLPAPDLQSGPTLLRWRIPILVLFVKTHTEAIILFFLPLFVSSQTKINCVPGRIRTFVPPVKSRVLFALSYKYIVVIKLAGTIGFEPMTFSLTRSRSTTELCSRKVISIGFNNLN